MATAARCEHVVLVVDDNDVLRESLADLLSDEGCSVLTAVNGAQALERLRQAPRPCPCLILLDLMMPVMNGREFYEQKQLDPGLTSIPVVFMSAEGNLGRGAIPAGGEYLAKPMRIETILGAIARHCGAGPIQAGSYSEGDGAGARSRSAGDNQGSGVMGMGESG